MILLTFPFFKWYKPAVNANKDLPTPAGASHILSLQFKSFKFLKKSFCFSFLHLMSSLKLKVFNCVTIPHDVR